MGSNSRIVLGNKLISSVACILVALAPRYSFAIDPPSSPPAAETAAPATPPAPSGTAEQRKFTAAELEKLLAPIALYPDALLAQLLPATAYPLELVQAERWLEKNESAVAKLDFLGADAEDWDPSVKAMLRFPAVVKKLSADLDWTSSLGDAIVNQPQDVASVIQSLRAKAQKAGALASTREQKVSTRKQDGRDVVVIESADPSVVYVPSYDPAAVYAPASSSSAATGAAVAAGLLTFGAAVAIGSAWSNNNTYWNWGTGAVYPPIWPGYSAWRPGGSIGGGNINIGNDVNIGNGSNNLRPWRPNPDHRPGGRPGLGGAGSGLGGNRPGLIGSRPGLGDNRPGLGSGAPVGNRPALGGGAGIAKPIGHPKPSARPAAKRPGIARPTARPAASRPSRLSGGGAALGIGHRPAAVLRAGGGKFGGGRAGVRAGGGRFHGGGHRAGGGRFRR